MIEFNTESILFYGMILLGILVVVILIALMCHSGLFSEIIIKTCKPYLGEITVAYKFAKGPYKESGTLFTEAHTLLPQYRTIGVYYDDPRKEESTRLRYIVGLIVSEHGKNVDAEDTKLLKKWGYSFANFPKVDHVVQTSFPFNNTISIIVGIYRVYPLLNEYIETRNLCAHPFMEIYDCEKSKIYFIGPLEKQIDFYTPEMKMEEDESKLVDNEEIN